VVYVTKPRLETNTRRPATRARRGRAALVESSSRRPRETRRRAHVVASARSTRTASIEAKEKFCERRARSTRAVDANDADARRETTVIARIVRIAAAVFESRRLKARPRACARAIGRETGRRGRKEGARAVQRAIASNRTSRARTLRGADRGWRSLEGVWVES